METLCGEVTTLQSDLFPVGKLSHINLGFFSHQVALLYFFHLGCCTRVLLAAQEQQNGISTTSIKHQTQLSNLLNILNSVS